MKNLVGKRVSVFLQEGSITEIFDGVVKEIEGSLVYLTDVRDPSSPAMAKPDEIINTNSLYFVRFVIHRGR